VNGPVMNYCKNNDIRKTVAGELSQTLFRLRQMPLTDTSTINIQFLDDNGNEVIKGIRPDFTDTDKAHLHLYIDLFELDPSTFFSFPENYPSDSSMLQRARSVFTINAWLLSANKTILLNEKLNIVISASQSAGMGILYGKGVRFRDLTVTPKGFTEVLKAGGNLLFDPKNELLTVEMKAPPAYHADNYILPNTIDQPRIYVATNKNVSTFNYRDKGEMIRLGEPVYEEIKIKGKKPEKYPEQLTNIIKHIDNYQRSDFVFLRQECRDVLRDKNYLVKLVTQVDPENPVLINNTIAFTDFLPCNIHYLFSDNDTLAAFSIQKKIASENNRVDGDRISNGVDSLSFFRLNVSQPVWMVIYDYVINGTISGHTFEIKCSGFGNTVKEIFLDKNLVSIVQGKFVPEKFVVLAPISAELLEQLFMIGFNRFLE
jgi:hypothetical protein